jgi:hypothetical protein
MTASLGFMLCPLLFSTFGRTKGSNQDGCEAAHD